MAVDRDLVQEALPGYQLEGEIGRGAFGLVLGATHVQLGRSVAIKQLPRAFSADPALRERFAAEAKILASFDHPHVVRVFDYVEHQGTCLLVMERLTGGSVGDVVYGKQAVAPTTACAIALAAAAGLAYAHDRGVLHRDVKPDNLMFAETGLLKVTDFGLAKVLGSDGITATGIVMGTPAYIAPEQAAGDPLSPATDVYAVGVVLFELLTGKLPFPDLRDPMATLRQKLDVQPWPLASVAHDLPADLAAVVDRALCVDPVQRWRDPRIFAAELMQAAARNWGSDWLASTGHPVLVAASWTPEQNGPETDRAGNAVTPSKPTQPTLPTPPAEPTPILPVAPERPAPPTVVVRSSEAPPDAFVDAAAASDWWPEGTAPASEHPPATAPTDEIGSSADEEWAALPPVQPYTPAPPATGQVPPHAPAPPTPSEPVVVPAPPPAGHYAPSPAAPSPAGSSPEGPSRGGLVLVLLAVALLVVVALVLAG